MSVIHKHRTAIRLRLVSALLFAVASADAAAQAGGYQPFEAQIDRSEAGKRTATLSVGEFEELSSLDKACLDFAVFLDGKSDYDVMWSKEDLEQRFNVGCTLETTGQLEMGPDIEYYIRSQAEDGRMDLSVYPGERSRHPYNDVACVTGESIDPRFAAYAAFRVRGFYSILTSDFGEFKVVQLRPPANPPTPEEIDACQSTFK
jgi:hypothetical protein